MEEKVLYSMESPFQQEINVKGYYFGKNEGKEHSACIVGALRGNEYQQLYICSKLIDVLKKIAGVPIYKVCTGRTLTKLGYIYRSSYFYSYFPAGLSVLQILAKSSPSQTAGYSLKLKIIPSHGTVISSISAPRMGRTIEPIICPSLT